MVSVKLVIRVISICIMYYVNVSFWHVTFLFGTKGNVGPFRAKLHRKESGCPT